MALRHSLPPWIALLATVPVATAATPAQTATLAPAQTATLAPAQTATPAPAPTAGIAELAVLGLVVYGASVAVSIVIGLLVLAVSEFVYAESYVRAIEQRISDRPIQAGALGFASIVAGVAALFVLLVVLAVLLAVGLPEPVGLLAAIPLFGGLAFLYVGATVGTIVVGAFLLRRVRGARANLWLALVVGALVVNLPLLNFLLAFLVLFLGTGAMVDRWWANRRGGDPTASPSTVDG
ncbi:hypothetical protein RH858_09725 [Halalkaliarchaeum sp. AArc-GB]|uniref:hypothetical protein n=1 Tax=Halalkaliarchaeum sp. AArc-GB TaxID=3074078 RepID=UPI00285C5383|nr:hypothetical protein [Halalkaliarchaeum sp. AArc-GB]MDR5673423.1 hypothetical protein [Halalkaliarchaeum sp. AArc-GB]